MYLYIIIVIYFYMYIAFLLLDKGDTIALQGDTSEQLLLFPLKEE